MDDLFLADPLTGSTVTYSELISDLNQGPHDVPVFCSCDHSYDIFKAYILAILCHLEVTLLDSDLSNQEIDKLLADDQLKSDSELCSLQNPIVDKSDLMHRLRMKSEGCIGFFTSGTTGLPKRVSHQLSTLSRSVKCSARHAESIWGFAYNPSHIAGCHVFLQAAMNGSSIVNVFGLNPKDVVAALIKYNVSHISATPTFYRMLMPSPSPITTVKKVTMGGERMDLSLVEKLKEAFPLAKFLNVYASTEAGTILVSEGEVFSIKKGLEGLVRIDDNQLLIHVSLLGQFQQTDSSSVSEWYATGDIVSIESEEPLKFIIQHRANELINVGGYNVNPSEIESILREIEGVIEVRVFAKKNSILGNLIGCDIVRSNCNLTEKAIRNELSGHLQSFKVPRLINFVDEIEITRTGKLKRS